MVLRVIDLFLTVSGSGCRRWVDAERVDLLSDRPSGLRPFSYTVAAFLSEKVFWGVPGYVAAAQRDAMIAVCCSETG